MKRVQALFDPLADGPRTPGNVDPGGVDALHPDHAAGSGGHAEAAGHLRPERRDGSCAGVTEPVDLSGGQQRPRGNVVADDFRAQDAPVPFAGKGVNLVRTACQEVQALHHHPLDAAATVAARKRERDFHAGTYRGFSGLPLARRRPEVPRTALATRAPGPAGDAVGVARPPRS